MAEKWKEYVGQISDREVSRRFGVSASNVRRYRAQQRIAPHNAQNAEMPEGLVDKLATSTNYQLMREFGISVSRVKALRAENGVPEPGLIRPRFAPLEDGIWTGEALELLGTMPDPELADRLGVSRTPVRKKRAELGIAAYQAPAPEITPEIAAEFSRVSDSAIAKRMGVSTSFIRRARVKWTGAYFGPP